MATCRQCGMCCTFLLTALPGITKDHDPLEVRKYVELHHCRTYEGRDGVIYLRIPVNCRHLEWDTATGKTVCLIYGKPERPQICREFICAMLEDEEKNDRPQTANRTDP